MQVEVHVPVLQPENVKDFLELHGIKVSWPASKAAANMKQPANVGPDAEALTAPAPVTGAPSPLAGPVAADGTQPPASGPPPGPATQQKQSPTSVLKRRSRRIAQATADAKYSAEEEAMWSRCYTCACSLTGLILCRCGCCCLIRAELMQP